MKIAIAGILIMLILAPVVHGAEISVSSSTTGGVASASSEASGSISASVNAYAGRGTLEIDIAIGNPGEKTVNLTIEVMVDSETTERKITLKPKDKINLSFSWKAEDGSHSVSYRVLDEKGSELSSGTQTVSVLSKLPEKSDNQSCDNQSSENRSFSFENSTELSPDFYSKPQKTGFEDIFSQLMNFFSYIFGLW